MREEHAHELGRFAAALDLHDEFAGGGFAALPASARDRSRGPRNPIGARAAGTHAGRGEWHELDSAAVASASV